MAFWKEYRGVKQVDYFADLGKYIDERKSIPKASVVTNYSRNLMKLAQVLVISSSSEMCEHLELMHKVLAYQHLIRVKAIARRMETINEHRLLSEKIQLLLRTSKSDIASQFASKLRDV